MAAAASPNLGSLQFSSPSLFSPLPQASKFVSSRRTFHLACRAVLAPSPSCSRRSIPWSFPAPDFSSLKGTQPAEEFFNPLNVQEDSDEILLNDWRDLFVQVLGSVKCKSSTKSPAGGSGGKGIAVPIEGSSIDFDNLFKGQLHGKFLKLLARVGTYVPLGGVDRAAFQRSFDQNSLLGTLDSFSGGGIGRPGICSLGIVHFINAQIGFQLVGVLYPKIQELQKKAGKAGRKVLQWTRYASFGFAIFEQGTGISCSTRSSTWTNSDDTELPPVDGMDGSASSSSSRVKRPWLTKLMLGLCGCAKPWNVPWTSFTIFQVMFLWFCTFWLVGSWIIPFAAHFAGFSKDTLTFRGQALYSLITDIAEGTVGLGILHRCLARFQPLPRNWFPFSWRGQWYIDVLLGCLTFPLVNRLSQLNLELLPFPSPLTSSYEQSIMARDPIASVLYAIVVSVCCPIWEEVIFRGFLLPSLTRYLPMWASIFVSAVVFGLAHFNVQRMLPLTFLGLVMGIMFVRSRNLLSSMLLHSLWNGFVFMGLLR